MTNAKDPACCLDALGDPTRRAVFERVAVGPVAVGTIAQGLPVSRPAVSQHLKVLRQAGLVRETADGTRRIYSIDPRGIGAMRDWLEAHWQAALGDFKAFADAEFVKDASQRDTPAQNDGEAE